ncbi:MAG: Co2+/Mg2+ efflux protein ApaG [Flavobacteriaceae bacterium]|nr:Co2+/Mg2+ efflux protein ApaG [Flavobacteriaceae bacterium]
MVEQITQGVKISVETRFKGTSYRNHRLYYVFAYFITIENKSNHTFQLTHRFWKIFDSLNKIDFVEGEGVVGQTPILKPADSYSYTSGCYLESTMGAMSGYYTMLNVEHQKNIKVQIPTFQLQSPFVLN